MAKDRLKYFSTEEQQFLTPRTSLQSSNQAPVETTFHSIPSHQIARNIFRKNASFFLNSLQDPVEQHESCLDPLLDS